MSSDQCLDHVERILKLCEQVDRRDRPRRRRETKEQIKMLLDAQRRTDEILDRAEQTIARAVAPLTTADDRSETFIKDDATVDAPDHSSGSEDSAK